MEQIIHAGIASLTPVWKELLDQIGINYSKVDLCDLLPVTSYSVIIINRKLSTVELAHVRTYIEAGGAVFDNGFITGALINESMRTSHRSRITATTHPFITDLVPLDINHTVCTLSSATWLDNTFMIRNIGTGILIFFGCNMDQLMQTTTSAHRYFPTTSLLPAIEEVSRVSKGELCHILFCSLRHLHVIRHIPFVHKWFFPGSSDTIFMFRIDSDFGDPKQVQRHHEAGSRNNIPITWFLHTAAHESWITTFSSFPSDEIALHCYNHFLYKNPALFVPDFKKGFSILEKNGLTPKGFVAPYGIFSPKHLSLLEDYGILYSSEFSLMHDALPFHPIINNHPSPILQIPIHPICINSLLKTKASDQMMIDYYMKIISWKRSRCSPVILYDHLLHTHSDVLDTIFSFISASSLTPCTFGQYALWWKQRSRFVFQASTQGAHLRSSSPVPYHDMMLCVWKSDTQRCCIIPNTTIDYTTTAVQTHNQQPPFTPQMDFPTDFRLKKIAFINQHFWRKKK